MEGHAWLLVLILIGVGSVRIAATYTVFNHTADESGHIACGMEWLDLGTYRYEPQHPPLARAMTALLPYVDGSRANRRENRDFEGATILYDGQGRWYDRKLALARTGILPFYWLGSVTVFLFARWLLGAAGGVAATAVFTFLPPIMAHAGLATTDMAFTSTLALSLYAAARLAEQPSWQRSTCFGLSGGLAILTKFSSLAYFPAAIGVAGATVLFRERGKALRSCLGLASYVACAGVVAFVVVWAGYRFSFGTAASLGVALPFPELFGGIQQVREHGKEGHLAYLLGEHRRDGWWAYFPVLLAVKTPLAVVVLAMVGLWKWRNALSFLPWAFMAGILIVAIPSRINIGVRHVLPIYEFLAVGAGAGVLSLVRQGGWRRGAAFVMLLWYGIASAGAHPDYLAYFNELAGGEPERIAADSDLDWGQDIKRSGGG